MTTQKYIIKKIITDFLIINLIINAAFFLFTFTDRQATLTLPFIGGDLLIGLVILGLLASLSGFINIERDLLKGHVTPKGVSQSKVYKTLPKSLFIRVVLMTVIAIVLVYPLFYHLPLALGVHKIGYIVGLGIKTISAGVAAVVVGLLVTYLVLGDYDALQSYGQVEVR